MVQEELPYGLGRSTSIQAKAFSDVVKAQAKSRKSDKPEDPTIDSDICSNDDSDLRSWSSGESVHDDAVGDEDQPALPEVTEAWNSIGLKCWEVALKGARAACEICGTKIKADEMRLDYRYLVTNSLRDQKRVHPGCVQQLPRATRARDIIAVQSWLAKEPLSLEAKFMLEDVLFALRK